MREAGVVGVWPVHADYRLDAHRQQLLAVGGVVRQYAPILRRELPSEVYRLHEGDTDGLLDFARRYGTLGYKTWGGPASAEGEPLAWIWAHARGVRLVMDGLAVLAAHDEEAARAYLGGLTVYAEVTDAKGQKRPMLTATVGHGVEVTALAVAERDTPLETVATVVQIILDLNMWQAPYPISRQAIILPGPKLRTFFVHHGMIQVVYWQLMDTIDGGQLRLCQECRRPFIATDARQRFCPPRFAERESRCAMRHRQRRRREQG